MRKVSEYVNITEACTYHVVCKWCLREHISSKLKIDDPIVYCPLDTGFAQPLPLSESIITQCLQNHELELKVYQNLLKEHRAQI